MLVRMFTSMTAMAAVCAATWMPAQETPPPPPKEEAPLLRVEEAKLDLGTIRAGDDAVGTFIFHNDGEEPVKIIRARDRVMARND